jgi:hypothetical protein
MKQWVLLLCLSVLSARAISQETKTKNVIIITLDGYRWQELFGGADPGILNNPRYVSDTAVVNQYGNLSETSARQRLMPFFWEVIATQGQLYGNRRFTNKVNCSNRHLLSYPGYSEMLVGFNDPSVSSNDKIENPNPTVLEFIQHQKAFRNNVVAFSTWDAFPYILREERSGIAVNAGTDKAEGQITEHEKWLNESQTVLQNPHGSRYDSFTYRFAFEYLKRERPRVMLIAFDETDEHAHGGRYDEYLKAAHNADKMISELWQWIQADPQYKDQTTLFITTDHGRGNGKNSWKKHQLLTRGSRQIWFAVMGPDTPSFGEMKFKSKYYQKQVASTIAAFLGLQYQHVEPVGDVVQTMLAVPQLLPEGISADQ